MGHNGNALEKAVECGAIALRGGAWGAERIPCQVAAVRIAGGGGVEDANNLHSAEHQHQQEHGKERPPISKGDATGGKASPCQGRTERRVAGGHSYLALGLFFERTRETKRSASYTLLLTIFRAAAASVGLSCGMGWVVVL